MSKFYISAGHGGSDPGAVSNHHKEKDYTLTISNKVGSLLKTAGHGITYARTSDISKDITSRTNEANKLKVDAFLDIHLNAGGGTGCEAFHTHTGGKGKVLAENICREIETLGYRNRGAKIKKNSSGSDYFGVIRQTTMPAVIVECCFIDSTDDMARLNVDRMAQAIAKGVSSVFPAKSPAPTPTPVPAKTVQEVAKEVIAGKWGEGTDREKRLKASGYDYAKVQAEVNKQLGAKPPTVAPTLKIGSKVKYSGRVYADSLGKGRGANVNGVFTVTILNNNAYGVHIGELGWVKKSAVSVI